MQYIEILIMLVGVHFLCDYIFQTDAIATGKNSLLDKTKFGVPWYYWLTSHAVTHGFGVGLVTNNVWMGVLETILHWFIDLGKCHKLYRLHTDQLLHMASKLLIVATLIVW